MTVKRHLEPRLDHLTTRLDAVKSDDRRKHVDWHTFRQHFLCCLLFWIYLPWYCRESYTMSDDSYERLYPVECRFGSKSKKVTRGGGREQNNFFFKSLYSATTWMDQFHFLQDINDVMCVMKTRFSIIFHFYLFFTYFKN